MAASAVVTALVVPPQSASAVAKAGFSSSSLTQRRISCGYVVLRSAGVRGGRRGLDDRFERLRVGKNEKKDRYHGGSVLYVAANASPAASEEEQIVRPQIASQEMRPPFNVLITGSTKGIGYALAKEFLREGDNVIICSRSEERVQNALKELAEEFGEGRVRGTVCDVSDAKSVENLANFSKSEIGYIDIWINNAGSNAYTYKPLVDTDDDDIAEIVQTNTLGVMLCCRQAIRTMRSQSRGGHIFNMDGAGADGNATPRFSVYGATKRSLAQFTKSLEAELRMQGVKNVVVHNLSPGMVTTDLLMSGVDTPQAKFFINVLAEPANEVASYLVPRIRAVAESQSKTSTYIRFLTGVKAYTQILARVIFKVRKDRRTDMRNSQQDFEEIREKMNRTLCDSYGDTRCWSNRGSIPSPESSISALRTHKLHKDSGVQKHWLQGLKGGFLACLKSTTVALCIFLLGFCSNLETPVKGRSFQEPLIFFGDETFRFNPGAEKTLRLGIFFAFKSTDSTTLEMNVPTEVQLSMSEKSEVKSG
ncbi:hypothetical protein R1flu_016157 [Riccia fluitans]|uniref:chlorophyll(ide) b reductase n=1 Tax=Riccia fluitans TaxID=41844 RepID=A0ABD1YL10_9MARC